MNRLFRALRVAQVVDADHPHQRPIASGEGSAGVGWVRDEATAASRRHEPSATSDPPAVSSFIPGAPSVELVPHAAIEHSAESANQDETRVRCGMAVPEA